jgi:hypothetical protein
VKSEVSLTTLLENIAPKLLPDDYVFCHLRGARFDSLPGDGCLAAIQEDEGLSFVLSKAAADREGLSYQGTFRCLSLQVYSSLHAVGLTAALTKELTDHGISANMIAGTLHDHVLVPSADGDRALHVLQSLSLTADERNSV